MRTVTHRVFYKDRTNCKYRGASSVTQRLQECVARTQWGHKRRRMVNNYTQCSHHSEKALLIRQHGMSSAWSSPTLYIGVLALLIYITAQADKGEKCFYFFPDSSRKTEYLPYNPVCQWELVQWKHTVSFTQCPSLILAQFTAYFLTTQRCCSLNHIYNSFIEKSSFYIKFIFSPLFITFYFILRPICVVCDKLVLFSSYVLGGKPFLSLHWLGQHPTFKC
jgi:hypothetical protein